MSKPVWITVRSTRSGESTDHCFEHSPIRVGRNRLNDLPLPFPFVSGWHAVIRFDERKARYFDLGSTNGSLHGGERVAVGQSVVIDPTATVVLGDLELVMRHGGGPAPQAGAASRAKPGRSSHPWMQSPRASGSISAGEIDEDRPSAAAPKEANHTAHVPMRQIHAALAALRPHYEAQRTARLAFERELRSRLDSVPTHVRSQTEAFIRREFTSTAEDGAVPPGPAPASAGTASVTRLAERLLPDVAPPRSEVEISRFLGCVRDVLETCAKGLVELQRGQEQFGREMGVKAIKEFTPLHVAGTAREVLAHLLNFRDAGPERAAELAGLFADTMIHQVALLNGVAEGGRALLARLDPDEIEREIRGWGSKAPKKWERFVATYRSLTAEDRALTEMLFGPEFARAYAQVGGEHEHEKE